MCPTRCSYNPVSGARGAALIPADSVALVNNLLTLGILSKSPAHAKDALATAYPLPAEAIDPDSPARSHRSFYTHAGAFCASSARASRELRKQRLQRIVELVQAQRKK